MGAGEDEAKLLNSSWGRTRTNVHGAGLDAFHFRQYLFACQARLLLALQRPVEARPSAWQALRTLQPGDGGSRQAASRLQQCAAPPDCGMQPQTWPGSRPTDLLVSSQA